MLEIKTKEQYIKRLAYKKAALNGGIFKFKHPNTTWSYSPFTELERYFTVFQEQKAGIVSYQNTPSKITRKEIL